LKTLATVKPRGFTINSSTKFTLKTLITASPAQKCFFLAAAIVAALSHSWGYDRDKQLKSNIRSSQNLSVD
jgi:hypothetical protein